MSYRFTSAIVNAFNTNTVPMGYTADKQLSICARVYITDIAQNNYFVNFNPSGASPSFGTVLRADANGSLLILCTSDNGVFSNLTTNTNAFTGCKWTSVVATLDNNCNINASGINGYLDGLNVDTTVGAGRTHAVGPTTPVSGTRIQIANRPDGARQFAGLIEDVRLYNRVLTSGEAMMYHLGTLSTSPASGCIFYAPLIHSSGATGYFYTTTYASGVSFNSGTLGYFNNPPEASPDYGTWPVTRFLQNYKTANSGIAYDPSGLQRFLPVDGSGGLVGTWLNRTMCSYNSTFANAREAYQTVSANSPTAVRLLNGKYAVEFTTQSGPKYLLEPYAGAAPTPFFKSNDYTIVVIGRSRRIGSSNLGYFVSRMGNNIDFYTHSDTMLGTANTRSTIPAANSITMYGLVKGPTGFVIYRDGDAFGTGVITTTGVRGTGYLGCNWLQTNGFDGQIFEYAEYQTALSPSEMASLWSYTQSTYGVYPKTRTVIQLGSSSMEGTASSGMADRTYWLSANTKYRNMRFINLAVGGFGVNNVYAQTGYISAITADALARGQKAPIVMEQIGSNDLYVSGTLATDLYALWSPLVDAVKAITRGPYLELTILPRTGHANGSANRLTFNALRKAKSAITDADLAAIPEFAEGYPASGTWYADTIHLKATGFQLENTRVLASKLGQAINGVGGRRIYYYD